MQIYFRNKIDGFLTLLSKNLQRFYYGSDNWYSKRLSVGMEGNEHTLNFLFQNFNKNDAFNYAEFGAYHGGTALKILEYFPNAITFLFDYDYSIKIMKENLKNYSDRVLFFGNSQKYLDSYNYTFSKLIAEKKILFDYVFIDGAHTFAIDALTFFLADFSLKQGGYIDFDDYDWTIETSSLRYNNIMKKMYPEEMFNKKQIKFLVDNFVRNSKYFEIVENKIFKKII